MRLDLEAHQVAVERERSVDVGDGEDRARPRRHQLWDMPASETSICPVIQPASSEARKATAGAMSAAMPCRRDRLEHLDELERLLVGARHHALGRRQAGCDRVDGDAVLADLARERAREAQDAALRRDVVGEVRRPGEDDVRGEVDDAAVARLAHRLVPVVAREERSVEVHRHDPPPLGEVDVVPRREGDDGGVVDEHVELPVGADRLVDHPLDVFLLRDVDLEPQAALRRRRLRTLHVRDDDRRPLFCELVRDRLADSLSAAGDDRHPAVQLAHRRSSCLLELVEVGCVLVLEECLGVV